MSAGWVAASVRGRGLARRCVGREGARQVARCGSLDDAVSFLASTPYGREIRPGMDLLDAQHAVFAAVLWHLRILAGWDPPLGAGPLRLLGAGFEVANIGGRLAQLAGQLPRAPYELGSTGTVWSAVSTAGSPAEVRAALGSSGWGDPGTDELPAIRLALQLAWARRVLDGVEGAGDWAISRAALVMARVVASGAVPVLGPSARRDARRLLGPGWEDARSIDELAERTQGVAARALRGVHGPGDLWRAEARWWTTVESDSRALAVRPRADAAAGIGVVGLLGADAWRVRCALAVAARGGDTEGFVDALG
jgi:hypothetical protein